MTQIHRPARKFTNAAKPGTSGQSHPLISNSSGFTSIDRNISVSAITSAFSVAPVQEALVPMAAVAFPGFDFELIPPEGETPNEAKMAEAKRGLIKSDKTMRRLKHLRRAWFDTIGYKHSFFNYSLSNDEGWILPDTFFHMPAESFAVAPRSLSGNDNFYLDELLKGLVVDKTDNSTHYYQSQTRSGDPVEIDPDTILHITDETPGLPVLAAIVPVIRQFQFARNKGVMGHLSRAAAPNAVATIDQAYLDLDYQGAKTLGIPTELWNYVSEVIKSQSTDTAFLMPPGTNLSYPAVSAKSPIEVDQYLRREIYTHLIPTTLLDTLGSAISKSSQPAMDFFGLLVNSWREINTADFEAFDTKLLQDNGFELDVRYVWWEISPKDPAQVHKEAFEGLSLGAISINEYREMHDMPPLDEAGKAELEDETNTRNGGML